MVASLVVTPVIVPVDTSQATKLQAAAACDILHLILGPLHLDLLGLVVDLNQVGAIEAARTWKETSGGVVIGFVSHVDVETVNRARAAGIDQVMARSRFVEVLPDLLKR